MKIKKIVILLFTLVHWLTTFITASYFFDPMTWQSDHLLSFILNKVLLLISLYLVYRFLYEAIFEKDLNKRRLILHSLYFFVPMMVLLLALWPGPIADGDMPYFINHVSQYSYNYYLHYLTSLVHIQALMLMPFLTGILIYQLIAYSLIMAYLVLRAKKAFRTSWAYLLYLLGALPSIAFFNLIPNRTPIYAALYILFVGILFFDYKEKRLLNWKKALSLFVVIGILSILRSEGIHFILIGPMVMALVYGDKALKPFIKNTLVGIGMLIIIIPILSIPQKQWEDSVEGNFTIKRMMPAHAYNITNMLRYPIEGDFEAIDKVLSVDIMKAYPSYYNNVSLMMGAERVGQYSQTDLVNFARASKELILDNPATFLKVRWTTFNITARKSIDMRQDFEYHYENTFKERSIFVDPIFPSLRNHLMHLLSNLKQLDGKDYYDSKLIQVYHKLSGAVSYNLYIPLFIILVTFVVALFKRSWFWVLITIGALMHTGIIFILAPAAFFMYYIPVHVLGWYILLLNLINFLSKGRAFYV